MVDPGGSADGPWRAVGWSVSFAVLTSVGLVALTWFLLTMDVLVALGLALVVPPDSEPASGGVDIGSGYGAALLLALAVNLLSAAALALLTRRTPVRSWAAWVTGCVAAGLAFLVAGSVLLLAVGISPGEFFAAL
ncbi:MAG: hypothetical protein WCA30_11925 [Dermatophilaceae bacterium]